jgi:hypothetical protein
MLLALDMERSCLVITGVDLRLATAGKGAYADGKAFGAMVMIMTAPA